MFAVSKQYRHRGPLVLNEVSLALEAGTLTRVQGENGSGKSTLLRLACGFSRPTRGTVHRSCRSFGFAPDRVTPPARMTARSYLEHLVGLSGTPGARAEAEAITDRLGLTPGLGAPLGTLSRGNLHKVVLAQALMRPVGLIVLDEPFAALDTDARGEVATLLQERLADGSTLLIATHADDLSSVGRTLRLDAGSLGAVQPSSDPPAEDLFAIDLAQTHPTTRLTPVPTAGGRARYLVPASQVEQFLQAALATHVRVLRLNPADQDGLR